VLENPFSLSKTATGFQVDYPRWIKNVNGRSRRLLLIIQRKLKKSQYDSSQPLNDSTSIYSMSITKNKIIKIMEILQEAILKNQNE
jgi:hypothetical protein